MLYIYTGGLIVLIIFLSGIRIIRPTQRGLIERFGKFTKFAEPGFNWIIPLVHRLTKVNTTEQMVDAKKQEIITNDNLNATVDAQVYFKVRKDVASVKASQYNVDDCNYQIVNLARTTLRNIIGTLTLKVANSERDKINDSLMETLKAETSSWGIDVVRTELKEIEPPQDVQATMNEVVKAENEKIAATDFATAKETQADGSRRAAIKEAEGKKRSAILEAEGIQLATISKAKGIAEAIKLKHEAANKYFIGNAKDLKKLETVEKALSSNTKIVLPADQDIVNVIGNIAGILPVKKQ